MQTEQVLYPYLEMGYVEWANLTAESIVVEVGAYEGKWAENLIEQYGCTLYTFDPSKRAISETQKRLKGTPRVHVYDVGLWDKRDTITLYDCLRDGANFYNDNDTKDEQDAYVVEATAFLRDELKLERIDLLALNCEGSEFVILPNLIESGYIVNVEQMMIQWHHILPDSTERRREICKALRQTHHTFRAKSGVWQLWRKGLAFVAEPLTCCIPATC